MTLLLPLCNTSLTNLQLRFFSPWNFCAPAQGRHIQYFQFRTEYPSFLPTAEVFHIRACIQIVECPCFFHKLKTLWRKFKTQVLKPVLTVEFHTFHRVFNTFISTGLKSSIHFVIFKSELWQKSECRLKFFCSFLQYHFDECEILLKIVDFSAPVFHVRMLYPPSKMLPFPYFFSFPHTAQKRILCVIHKKRPLDWFYGPVGVYLGCTSLNHAQSIGQTRTDPDKLWR